MSPVTMIRQPTICMDDVSSLKDRIMQLKLSERQRDTVDLLFRPLERNLESNTSPKGTIHAASALISVAYHNAGSDDIARAEGIKASLELADSFVTLTWFSSGTRSANRSIQEVLSLLRSARACAE